MRDAKNSSTHSIHHREAMIIFIFLFNEIFIYEVKTELWFTLFDFKVIYPIGKTKKG